MLFVLLLLRVCVLKGGDARIGDDRWFDLDFYHLLLSLRLSLSHWLGGGW